MEALLSAYSVEQILLFSSILVGAVIATMKSFDFLYHRLADWILTQSRKQKQLKTMGKNIELLLEKSKEMDGVIKVLKESDMRRIRAEITREYQKRCKSETIDFFTLQYLQGQYLSYVEEGGNSYIAGLMNEIQQWEIEKWIIRWAFPY